MEDTNVLESENSEEVESLEAEFDAFGGEAELQAYLSLKTRNHGRFKKLAEQGFRIDPVQIIQVQFDVLLTVLGPQFTAAWAMAFETRMSDVLLGVEKDLPRQKLLQGTQQPSQPLPPELSKLFTPSG